MLAEVELESVARKIQLYCCNARLIKKKPMCDGVKSRISPDNISQWPFLRTTNSRFKSCCCANTLITYRINSKRFNFEFLESSSVHTLEDNASKFRFGAHLKFD